MGRRSNILPACSGGEAEPACLQLVLPVKGRALCICPALKKGGLANSLAATLRREKMPRCGHWQEDDNPYQLLATGFRDFGLSTWTRWGMEERVRFVFSDGIAKVLPQLKIVSGTPVTAQAASMIKSDHELELMSLANRVTLTAYQGGVSGCPRRHDRGPTMETLNHRRQPETGIRRGGHRHRRNSLIPRTARSFRKSSFAKALWC